MYRILLVALLFTSSHAFAVFDAQLTYGQKTSKYKPDGASTDTELKGSSIGLGAHFHPLTALPVGVGLFMNMDNLTSDEDGYEINATSQAGGLELNAWVPLPVFKPFIKVNYLLFGSAEAEIKGTSTLGTVKSKTKDATLSGSHIALGVEWSIVPTFGLILQYAIDSEELKYKKVSVTDVDGTSFEGTLSKEEKTKLSGNTISLGVGFRL